jgi:predicted double-glycine peptidase
MKINELFEAEEKFNSDEIVNALTTDDLDDKEIPVIEFIKDKINQSYPDGVSSKDLKKILKDPAVKGMEDEYEVQAKEILQFIFQGAEIELKV